MQPPTFCKDPFLHDKQKLHCSHFTDEAGVSQTCGDLSDGKPANWSVGGFPPQTEVFSHHLHALVFSYMKITQHLHF